MPERITRARLGKELAFGVANAFGGDHRAPAHPLHRGLHLGQEGGLVEHPLGKQNEVRRRISAFACEAGSGSDPAGMTSHHFKDEDLGGGVGHGGDIQARL